MVQAIIEDTHWADFGLQMRLLISTFEIRRKKKRASKEGARLEKCNVSMFEKEKIRDPLVFREWKINCEV